MTEVDITLLSWNGERDLPALLESIAAQTHTAWRLWALDNASEDASTSLLRNFFTTHPGELAMETENIGFDRGHNKLIRKGHAPYILVLNQDVVLQPNFLERVISFAESHPTHAAVSGLLVRPGSRGEAPTVVDSAGLKLFATHRVVDYLAGQPITSVPRSVYDVFGVSAAVVLFRRSALEQVALARFGTPEYFDEQYFAYKEDVDLCYRLQLNGWSIAVLPEVHAVHRRTVRSENRKQTALGSIGTLRNRRQKSDLVNYWSYRNHLFFLTTTAFFSPRSLVWLKTLAYELGKLCVLLISNPGSLRALSDLWKGRKQLRQKRQEIRNKLFTPSRIYASFRQS